LIYLSLFCIVSTNAETNDMSERMLKEKEIVNNLKKNLNDLFKSTNFINVKDIKSEGKSLFPNQQIKPDLIVEIQGKDQKKYHLVFEVRSEGQPRYARMAASLLKNMIGSRKNMYGVFAATFISEESKQICRESGIGFIDLAGNCHFAFDNVYLSIEGRPNPYPSTRPLKSIFSSKSTRALRVLLCNPRKEWFVKDLAKEANISLGLTSNIKQRLLEFEFIEETGSGKDLKFKPKNPEKLLRKWTDNYSYRKNRVKNFYSLDDVETLETKMIKTFSDKKITYAFTLSSGAARVAPFLRYNIAFAYVKDDIYRLAKDLNLKEVTSGPNVSFLEPYDEGVFYGLQKIDGANIVSDIQLYLDLKNYKGRGEEAAEFLYEQRIQKLW
jgi:hypothetical protein